RPRGAVVAGRREQRAVDRTADPRLAGGAGPAGGGGKEGRRGRVRDRDRARAGPGPGTPPMTPWPVPESFDVRVVGERLALLLLGVIGYYVVVGLVVQWEQLRAIDLGSGAALINTVILSLLMSFRNTAAYQRWWEARGLWGQLTNDCRNL